MTKTIYVVDDDPVFCELITQTLRDDGYDAIPALNGEEALSLYKQAVPDLVLLDVAMPGKTGFDVAAEIRETEQKSARRTIIVIMTAHARSYAISRDFHAGIDGYLLKPVSAQEVLAQVHQLLPKTG